MGRLDLKKTVARGTTVAAIVAAVVMVASMFAAATTPTAGSRDIPRSYETKAVPPPYASWAVPSGFGQRPSLRDPQAVYDGKPPRRVTFNVGASSGVRLRHFRWSTWHVSRVVGRGESTFCNYRGCECWRNSRIVLDRWVRFNCGGDTSGSAAAYARYRLFGFSIARDGAAFRAYKVC